MEIGVGQAEDTELSCLCVSVRARGDSREIFVRKHYCFMFCPSSNYDALVRNGATRGDFSL